MTALNEQPESHFNIMPIQRVLIALDYDPTAQKVAETGYSIANAMNAEVTLLHVIAEQRYYSALSYSPIMGYTGYSNIDPALNLNTDDVKKASYDFLDKSRQHLGGEKIKTIVAEGDFAESILEQANDLKADLIVMGTHSKRWLEKVIMGSVAEKVLKHSTIPLLIIPTKGIDKDNE
jgi:nucleotide-binding universal stress UspA family protein